MPTFKVIGTGTLQHSGTTYQPGDSIELNDQEAESLIIDGCVAPFEGRIPKEPELPKEPDAPKISDLKKEELVEKARELEIELDGDETKAVLIEKINEKLSAPAGDDL
jgi:hypothetical protein